MSACGDDGDDNGDAGSAADDTTYAVTAEEPAAGKYAFKAPATMKAGVVTIDLTNGGQEPHQAAFVKLEDGKTLADYQGALAQATGPGQPEFAVHAGGVAAATPGGGTANVTQELDAGDYVLFCEIPGPDGKPHAANGMMMAVTVDGDSGAEMPDVDQTIEARDFTFDVPELKAGEATIEMVNAGPSDHEVVMIALQPGKKGADVATFFSGPPTGPPPFRGFVGGLAPIANGGKGVMTADLAAGDYAFMCFVPTADGKPHFAVGMMKDITVT